MATADVLRAHSILMPAPQRTRAAAAHRSAAPGASSSRRRSPAAGTSSPAAGKSRRHGRKARPAPAEVYAGPAFSTSPDPSSLPLPQFPTKKQAVSVAAAVNAAATRDLRLILRLE